MAIGAHRIAVIITAAALMTGTASAHVVFATPEATIGKTYRGALQVTHGCKGQATTSLSVDIPPGFVGVKPQAKPGWQIELTKGAYDRPYQAMHGTLTDGVKRITWSGNSLPNDFFDEFVFSGLLDPSLQAGATLYFPVTQLCGEAAQRWVQIPAPGQDAHALEFPAAGLKLLTAASADDHRHMAMDARPDTSSGAPIVIDQPWSRATPGGAKVAAGYLVIKNTGTTDDRLVSVLSPELAERGEVHEMAMKDNVMTMHPVDGGLAVPAGQSVTLKPGSFHLMFQNLKHPLKQGDQFSATLVFEKAGAVPVTFDVQGIAATGAGASKSDAMGEMHDPMKMDH